MTKPSSAIVILCLLSVAVSAADNQGIEEIQVTATRRPQSALEVSAAVTSIDARDDATRLLTDLLSFQPGVYLQQTTPGQGSPIVRGLKGSAVLNLVDGMRLNNAIFRNAPTQYLALVDTSFIERLEVQRGSAAALYGSDAMGGVVQALTRKPRINNKTELRGDVSSTFDTATLAKSLEATIEVSDTRLAGLVTGTIQNIGNRRIGTGERVAPSGYQTKGARAALVFEPNENHSWLFDVQFVQQPETPRIDELVVGFGEIEPAASEFFFAPNERAFAHLGFTQNDGWLNADWQFDLAWQEITDDRITREFGSDLREFEENRSDLYGFTANVNKVIGKTNWIFGAESYRDVVRSHKTGVSVSSAATSELRSRFPDDSKVDQLAVYARGQREYTSRLSLSGGLRWSQIEVTLPGDISGFSGTSVDVNDLSGELGLVYQLGDKLRLLANAGRGFRAPNVFDLGTFGARPGNRFSIPNPGLAQETINQFDIGLRLTDTQFRAEIVAYLLNYNDRIASIDTGDINPDGRTVVQNQNVNQSDLHGLEASFYWQLSDDWQLSFLANYTFATDRSVDGTSAGDRIPPFNGELGVSYTAGSAFTVRPFVQFARRQDRLSPRDVRDSRINPNGTPGWVTVNLEFNYEFEQWGIFLVGENLFNQTYRHHGSGIDAIGRNGVVGAHWRF